VTIGVVVFDVGETLVDESRTWTLEAERAGVPPLTFFAALGALIERGEDHRRIWELLGVERPHGPPPGPTRADLYPDALPCLERLRAAGYRLGVAGNQPADAIEALDLPADFVASSAGWGVEKPDARYFERVTAAAGMAAGRIAHVGDRVDNDVLPAKRAGMLAVFIRRGPWGHIHAARSDAAIADARIESLHDLAAVLSRRSSL
jgi:HAD superfamily hydrolase (TIGR01509 family)